MRYLLVIFISLNSLLLSQSSPADISGTVTNSIDRSPVSNCNIIIAEISIGTVTDSSGKFKINFPIGRYTLKASHVGYESFERIIIISKDNASIIIDITLNPASINLKEVTVTGNKEISSTIIQEIEQKDLQRMPTIYNDVLRAVQVLPGVSTNNELSSGYNVRGGNFDDNLIYLNGFEIYRPFLLRQGVEENKTIINPDLVEELRFYNGSFPASYGDKMSSALEVNYNIKNVNEFSGIVKADFLNTGITLKNNFGNLKTAAAFRYAYPGLFLNGLQTNGDYKPQFADFQFLANYLLNQDSQVEIFFLYADNKFNLTPENWTGSFGGYYRGDYRGLDIIYDGERKYSFKTGLTGLKYSTVLSNEIQFGISAARYSTIEDEFSDVASEYYYSPDANSREFNEYVKSGKENIDNYLELTSHEIIPQLSVRVNNHLFTTGVNIRLSDVENRVNESFTETNDSLLTDYPSDRFINQNFNLNSYSAFIQDEININQQLLVNAGVRLTYYGYNKDLMISPRINANYILSTEHNINFSWGYYYQPPYYAELRNKEDVSINKLDAQKAIHYSAGWEYQFREKLKFNFEAYYKALDDLIPYYIDREKTEYLNENSNDGFSYGFDLMVQGEIVEGMNSWIGYGYLDTQEKNKSSEGGSAGYHRRLTDQTHTLQIFMQDKIKKHPNWQSHFRLLFGSGYLYNLREKVTEPRTEKRYLLVSVDKLREYAMYFRVDMGLSASFDLGNSNNLLVVAEILNLFNHRNFGGYRFAQVSKEINTTFAIPQILSSRFFNVGVEVKF